MAEVGPVRARLLALATCLALAGCAYELTGWVEVTIPEAIGRVRRVAVARFVYPHDWTGQFRDIYRRADIQPPEGKKTDRLDRTFLVEDALAVRGYRVLRWPKGEGAPGEPPSAALRRRLRERGADALLLARGESACQSVEHCTARVTLSLWGTEAGALLWRGEARAATLIAQGDEMQAAVQEALAGLAPGR